MRNCKVCGVSFHPFGSTHVYCGNRKAKTGCSYKVASERSRVNMKTYKRIKRPHNRGAYLLRTYGISEQEYNHMLNKQNGVCAICEVVKEQTLAVDHDHFTGRVRGLLCDKCNQALGFLQDSIVLLDSAKQYLQKSISL